MKKNNVVLADCEADEVESFKEGLEFSSDKKFEIKDNTWSQGKRNFFTNLRRYFNYFAIPFGVFTNRKKYDIVVGWQQFYTNNYAFFCRLFKVKKCNKVISCNFTYRRKKGLIGTIYYRYMKYALATNYIDHLHVLSHEYAERCSKELDIPIDKFVVTAFGIPDYLKDYQGSKHSDKKYVLSLGRSNRDFNFLLEVWSKPELKDFRLVIISDTFHPITPVPANVTIHNNIVGDVSKLWVMHCDALILPIDDGNLASGDTVLLLGMQFEKPVIVTKPSTLAEMYINNGVNGWSIEKDVDKFASTMKAILTDTVKMEQIGREARQSYLNNFSRLSLGKQVGKFL